MLELGDKKEERVHKCLGVRVHVSSGSLSFLPIFRPWRLGVTCFLGRGHPSKPLLPCERDTSDFVKLKQSLQCLQLQSKRFCVFFSGADWKNRSAELRGFSFTVA